METTNLFFFVFMIISLIAPILFFVVFAYVIRAVIGSIGKKTVNTRNGYDTEYLKAKTQKEPKPVCYCDYCGGQIEEETTQCKYCGASIKQGVK